VPANGKKEDGGQKGRVFVPANVIKGRKRSQMRGFCARKCLKRKMVVTKGRVLCPQTLKKEDGGHKREGFVPANIKK
jgi:hypothetical protein